MTTPTSNGWKIQWLTPDRHGLVEALTRREADALHSYLLDKYSVYSKHGVWWSRDPVSGLWACEFHTRPGYTFPWSIDGSTRLFTTWQSTEVNRASLKRQFSLGDPVRFTDSRTGTVIRGIVSGGRKRATVVVPNSRVKWHVPYSMLEHDDVPDEF